ncbi:agrin-like [Anneissia japonica]|uniref:agrin-like n=1 Tax=Anneissia japonica TaxID=1529436 RepID=UPI001425754D|nr:agrin-like [Anneissia japonica]
MLRVSGEVVRLLGLAVLLITPVQGRYLQCREQQSIEKREEEANIVVSGLVDRIMREPKQMTYSCEVKIIRFFKGKNQVSNDMSQDNRIMVKGFGNPSLCDTTAHKGDVRILMLNQDSQGQFALNSSLVRITIGNLEQAEAAVSEVQGLALVEDSDTVEELQCINVDPVFRECILK